MSVVRPVVLCGGAGSRLWPASRVDRPKPLLPLVGDDTLVVDTVRRFSGPGFAAPWLVCGVPHADALAEVLPDVTQIVEAVPRGTAAAIVAAAARAAPDELLLVTPADHHVEQPDVLCAAVARGARAARDGQIVTFGIVPTFPATGYGWIRPGPGADGVFAVDRFLEKPTLPVARTLFEEGACLWNSGMFLFRADVVLSEMRRLAPDLPGGSFDVVVMEHTRLAAVVPVACGWSDVGTWDVVQTTRGGRSYGPVTLTRAAGSFGWSDGPAVVVAGVPDVLVVASGGAVLVTRASAPEVVPVDTSDVVLDAGVGWQVRRRSMAPGDTLELGSATVLSGRVRGEHEHGPGEVLPAGVYVALTASVVLILDR